MCYHPHNNLSLHRKEPPIVTHSENESSLNALYYGDNLAVLGEYVPDESVDLIYLDPPFNSNASHNVLFSEKSGEDAPAQIKAFTDTWQWTQETERTYELDIIRNRNTPLDVKEMMAALRQFLGRNDMTA